MKGDPVTGMGEMSLKLRVRYCGGCNPLFDRGELVDAVIGLLKEFSVVKVEENGDMGLLVCGCRVGCADRDEIKAGAPAWVVVAGDSVDCRPISMPDLPFHLAQVIRNGGATCK